jgi:hypothetical protein
MEVAVACRIIYTRALKLHRAPGQEILRQRAGRRRGVCWAQRRMLVLRTTKRKTDDKRRGRRRAVNGVDQISDNGDMLAGMGMDKGIVCCVLAAVLLLCVLLGAAVSLSCRRDVRLCRVKRLSLAAHKYDRRKPEKVGGR